MQRRYAQEVMPSARLLALMASAECHLMTSDFAAANVPLQLMIAEASPESESFGSNVFLLQSICSLALRQSEQFRIAIENLSNITHMAPMSALMRSVEAACKEKDWLLAEELIEKMLLQGACADAMYRALHSLRASP
jgi:hypothetical protein